jgi:hypothetical protein
VCPERRDALAERHEPQARARCQCASAALAVHRARSARAPRAGPSFSRASAAGAADPTSARGTSSISGRGRRGPWAWMAGRGPLSFADLSRCGQISSVRSPGGRFSPSRSRWRSPFPIRTSPKFMRRSRFGLRGRCRQKRRTRCEQPWIRSSSFFAAWGATRRRLPPAHAYGAPSAGPSSGSRVCDFPGLRRPGRAPQPLRCALDGCDALVAAAARRATATPRHARGGQGQGWGRGGGKRGRRRGRKKEAKRSARRTKKKR